MKVNYKLQIIFLLFFTWSTSNNTVFGQAISSDDRLAFQTANEFAARLIETRNLESLISGFFLSDFESHLNGNEAMPEDLYNRLSTNERKRLFLVGVNVAYLILIDGACSETKWSMESAFTSSLPLGLASKLKTEVLIDNELSFTSLIEFQRRIPQIEKILSEARSKSNSKCAEKVKKLWAKFPNSNVEKYPVSVYDSWPDSDSPYAMSGFPSSEKFFHVNTPIQIGVVLVKRGEKMRIVNLTEAKDSN